MKNMRFFYLNFFSFGRGGGFSICLNRRVFVICCRKVVVAKRLVTRRVKLLFGISEKMMYGSIC